MLSSTYFWLRLRFFTTLATILAKVSYLQRLIFPNNLTYGAKKSGTILTTSPIRDISLVYANPLVINSLSCATAD